ncbi:hypothetical protein BT96DRAFT_997661 [Gymnopus androsaceus JB14]|uniref:Nephrocystin 3-like N-terminal domain-containing protein n=1 Tax=Gymnopus androsaceus JB14 TaxID=1447944 RepID=A0A6A4HB04_9AGAR|nr:hypothetical protein BT96DRAFT_997661 [Gymnopus androsaceus JB14]
MSVVFPNARNFSVSNSSFANVGGDYIHYSGKGQDYPGLDVLYQYTVQGAFYDSEQRFPSPNCHPGTRSQVLEILRHWTNTDVADRTSIYWLYGAAGMGKSAFAREDPSRNSLSSFFITISYQLATSSALTPLLKDSIDRTVRDTPGIIHANLEEQFRAVIVSPCNSLTAEQWNSLPRLIVIDGLDECIDIASQERLLSIICQAKTAALPLPFKFLICSRPEPRIWDAFRHQDLHSMLDCHDIGESFESGKDIAKYLIDNFGRIRQEHGWGMAHATEDWPGNVIIQQLVQKACGQFIYATTVIKYVGCHDSFPIERLEIILKITMPKDFDSPYPDLDLLYMQILSVCAERELVLDVMAHILSPRDILFTAHCVGTSARIIEGLFFLAKRKVWALLFRLHSVLRIPENDSDDITVRHASFVDFLTDQKRSGKYFVNIDESAQHERVVLHFLRMISESTINESKYFKQ